MPYTGHRISDGHVYGPNGYIGYRVGDEGHVYGPHGYTGFYIRENYIYGPSGYTSYYGSEQYIYGPWEALPWTEA